MQKEEKGMVLTSSSPERQQYRIQAESLYEDVVMGLGQSMGLRRTSYLELLLLLE